MYIHLAKHTRFIIELTNAKIRDIELFGENNQIQKTLPFADG
jgi:hypothetical protein